MCVSNRVTVPKPMVNEAEVLAKTTRRRFSAGYNLGILREADACTQAGEF